MSEQNQNNIEMSDAFKQAHNDLKMVIPQKHWGSLTAKFADLGGISPVESFMRGGRASLQTIRNMFPEQNIGG